MTLLDPVDADASHTGRVDAEPAAHTVPADAERTKLGRKRDHTRDPEILAATLDVLAETGYDRMTIDDVAARAKAGKATLYRRWPSKAHLVVDAVGCMKQTATDHEHLPDTGTLRGDLLALIRPHTIEQGERKMRIMAGLFSVLQENRDLADAVNAAIVEPRARATRLLLERAAARGEIAADHDLELLSLVSQATVAYRLLVLGRPADVAFLTSIVDEVVLPAVGIAPERPRR